MPVRRVSLAEKLASFREPWSPKVVGALNGQLVKLARTEGEFVWHRHEDEDELFLVLEGELELRFRDGVVSLGPGELAIVPRGVEHQPAGTASILLFEPASTRNTGGADDPRTVEPGELEWI